nr:reverse transcriptase domain-containing protein [Tanacetum cinerariifolium]
MSQTEQQKEKVAKNTSNKRKWEGNHNGSSSQQNKGHKVPRAHTAWPINKKAYAGSLPLCNQCKFHHNGPCTNQQQQPNKRQNTGRVYTATSGKRKEYAGTLPMCNKCKFHHNGQCTVKNQGHYRSDCPELKNQDHGNQAGVLQAKIHADSKDDDGQENRENKGQILKFFFVWDIGKINAECYRARYRQECNDM